MLEIMKKLEELYKQALAIMLQIETIETANGEKVYQVALNSLGRNMSVNQEYGCAEAVNNVVQKAIGKPIGGDVSTFRMYKCLQNRVRFMKTTKPIRGDIIISPTGHGSGALANGHVGIIMDNSGYSIASDNTKTGLFDTKYMIYSWRKRYQTLGGFPVEYYRVI